MLFVLAMEVFNHVLSWLDSTDLLTVLGQPGQVQRVSLYADDLVMFLKPVERDIQTPKTCLQIW